MSFSRQLLKEIQKTKGLNLDQLNSKSGMKLGAVTGLKKLVSKMLT